LSSTDYGYYAVRLSRSRPSGNYLVPGAICDAGTGVQTATISMSDELPGPPLAFYTEFSGSTQRSQAVGSVGSDAFKLIVGSSTTYPADEPLTNLTSTLVFVNGDSYPIDVWGGRPSMLFQQLDGDLQLLSYGSVLTGCPEQTSMARGDSIDGRFDLSTPMEPGDPNYEYASQYAYDGQIRLPAGTYIVFAGTSLTTGPTCTDIDGTLRLKSAVVIEVR
jgi:hypothetical protein